VSDRTYQSVMVYACPEALREEALEIIAEYECRDEDETVLHLREPYWMEEGSFGTAEETARALRGLGDGIVAVTSEDPKYDYLGQRFTVLDGKISCYFCDASGLSYLFVDDLFRILDQSDLSAEERLASIEALVDLPRLKRITDELGRV